MFLINIEFYKEKGKSVQEKIVLRSGQFNDEGKIVLRWRDEWNLNFFDNN